MIKFKYSLALLGLGLMILSSIVPGFASTTTMKDTLGSDFSSNFGLVIDLNAQGDPNTNTINTNVQVLQDLGNSGNTKVNPVDQNPTYDQQFFFSHFNVSGVSNIYLALNKLEFDITMNVPTLSGTKTVDFGHVNGSAPFQTLLQYFKTNGTDVLVANTFRGLIAYTTNSDNGTISNSAHSYFGYSFVEQHLLNLTNTAITNKGFPALQPYGFEPLYFPQNNTFGMIYTNYFVVWQNATTQTPGGLSTLSSYVGGAFNNVATGGQMVGASLFKYMKFTYHVEQVSSNATTTIVNVQTNYDLGPMEWLITNDDFNSYNNIVNHNSATINQSDSFQTNKTAITFKISTGLTSPLPTEVDLSVNIPALSFYTGDAVTQRINAAAMQSSGATGMGIAFASSTNAIVLGNTVTAPNEQTNSNNFDIPLSFGQTNFFKTDFTGKSTYTRYFSNGTNQPNLPIYVTTRSMADISNIIDTSSLVRPYFLLQDLQTIGIAYYSALQLNSGFTSSSSTGLGVDSTAYVTLVQMPKWSGLQVTQDPTFSAVAAVASNNPSSSGSTSSSNTSGAPGFELFAIVFAVIPLFIYRKKSRRN